MIGSSAPQLLRASLPLLRMLTPAPARRALNALPIFLDYLADRQAFANETTRQMLEQAGIQILRPQDYLTHLFAYYLEALSARPARRV